MSVGHIDVDDGYSLLVGHGEARHVPDEFNHDLPACGQVGGLREVPDGAEELPKCQRCEGLVRRGVVSDPAKR